MDGTSTALKPIIDGIDTIVVVAGEVFTFMLSNPLLVLFLSASLITVGIRLFKKAKSAAKG